MGFRDIQKLATAIINDEATTRSQSTIILVLQTDHAKVIGQTLTSIASRNKVSFALIKSMWKQAITSISEMRSIRV